MKATKTYRIKLDNGSYLQTTGAGWSFVSAAAENGLRPRALPEALSDLLDAIILLPDTEGRADALLYVFILDSSRLQGCLEPGARNSSSGAIPGIKAIRRDFDYPLGEPS